MPIDPAFDSALRSTEHADDASIAAILLSVSEGIDVALSRCRWDTDSIFVTVGILGRLPTESAPARLVLGAFFGQQLWRDRYSDSARRLHELLPARKPEEQRSLAIAWVRLALVAIDEQMADKYTHSRISLPLSEMQQAVQDFVGRAARGVFDDEARKTVLGLLSRLSSAHREQLLRGSGSGATGAAGGGGGLSGHGGNAWWGGGYSCVGGASSVSAAELLLGRSDSAWLTMALAPTEADLDSARCADPAPNLIKGAYNSPTAYLGTHFNLLREDFIRPLRSAV